MIEDRLIEWRPFALTVAREYRIPGAERQDVEQEALFALWKAFRDYDHSRDASFKTFAALVIRRHLITCMRAGLREKHRPLNLAARTGINDDGEDMPIVELVAGGRDPADVVIALEEIRRLRRGVAQLSPLEREALGHVVAGVRYAGRKEIDNGAHRAKRKLREAA